MKKFMMHILHRSLHRPGNTTDGNHAQKHKVGVNAVYYIIAHRRQFFATRKSVRFRLHEKGGNAEQHSSL